MINELLENVNIWLKIERLQTMVFFFSTIQGRMDQVNSVLLLDRTSVNSARYSALDRWTTQLNTLHFSIINKMA